VKARAEAKLVHALDWFRAAIGTIGTGAV
jgi:hypothetical protein